MQIDYPPVDNILVYVRVYAYRYVCVCICMYVYMNVHVYVYCMYVCIYVWIYVCMYICVYVCMYVHVCAYTRILLFSPNNKREIYTVFTLGIRTPRRLIMLVLNFGRVRFTTRCYVWRLLDGWRAVWTLLGRGVPPGSTLFAQAIRSKCIRWVR